MSHLFTAGDYCTCLHGSVLTRGTTPVRNTRDYFFRVNVYLTQGGGEVEVHLRRK